MGHFSICGKETQKYLLKSILSIRNNNMSVITYVSKYRSHKQSRLACIIAKNQMILLMDMEYGDVSPLSLLCVHICIYKFNIGIFSTEFEST